MFVLYFTQCIQLYRCTYVYFVRVYKYACANGEFSSQVASGHMDMGTTESLDTVSINTIYKSLFSWPVHVFI